MENNTINWRAMLRQFNDIIPFEDETLAKIAQLDFDMRDILLVKRHGRNALDGCFSQIHRRDCLLKIWTSPSDILSTSDLTTMVSIFGKYHQVNFAIGTDDALKKDEVMVMQIPTK